MENTLKSFVGDSLFEATSNLLEKLNIQFNRLTAQPVEFTDLYDGTLPKYLVDSLKMISATYYIGIINDLSLQGHMNTTTLSDVADIVEQGGKYDGMFVFACEVFPEANLTRTVAAQLTRTFNRIASANPVILILRQANMISLATCERMEYTQAWRNNQGEKLGKVSILRNINCNNPHRGHIDILKSLGDKVYPTFEALYRHWMEIFSNELLTKKFYNELSDWYAWAVQVAKFPNDLNTTEDDEKYNHEACIRLITRLIFVWFLKQKHLIPEEFFDEKYIGENFIDNFNPHDKQSLLYDAEKSLYYRLILQNLFFAMLNCPIVAEGKTTPNNRRFVRETATERNQDFDINNLMRYKSEFKDGGSEKFLKFANSCVPFLNGGLFDCLDDKVKFIYYDGFSEEKKSLDQLSIPDYLFFGDEVGAKIDLSKWYADSNKKNVSARGLIDILKHYSFTIEENTPYDQEVSLDPELLGKVFENLLAAFNPETKTSARKQTGSFYTPREIVQYMVDESLVAHLKRICGDEMESEYRSLISYADGDVTLTDPQKKSIMNALYNCRVLDPACGSGAFPMGILQKMVHILKKIDPTNEKWNDLMIELALSDAKKELQKAADNEIERVKVVDNKNARLADIEQAFNQNINDPDYARKLYLIEHCIYGVDIQPIAIQISKLRFFISLVVDQKPTKDSKTNFGIRPLPNLEAKFVAANTLIPLDRKDNLFTISKEFQENEKLLQDLNHSIFLAKRNKDKADLKNEMNSIRIIMAQELESQGCVSENGYDQLVRWNMFDQNASAPFFDPEWMFGIIDGFDIVIGNPPYISAPAQMDDPKLSEQRKKLPQLGIFESLYQKWDLYIPFMEFGIQKCKEGAVMSMIVPFPLTNQLYSQKIREFITNENTMFEIVDLNGTKIFENATVSNCIPFVYKGGRTQCVEVCHINENKEISKAFTQRVDRLVQDKKKFIWNLTQTSRNVDKYVDYYVLGDFCYISKGMCLFAEDGSFKKTDLLSDTKDPIHCREYVEGKNIDKYIVRKKRFLEYNTYRSPSLLSRPTFPELYSTEKIIFNILGTMSGTYDNTALMHNNSLNACILWKDLIGVSNKSITTSIKKFSNHNRHDLEQLSRKVSLKYLLGIMNSKLASQLLSLVRGDDYHIYPEHVRNIPIVIAPKEVQDKIEEYVNSIIQKKIDGIDSSEEERMIDSLVCNIYSQKEMQEIDQK